MDQKQKKDSKTISPILNIAEALSCAGAFIVGVIWSAAMINCFLNGSNYLDFSRNVAMAWIWGVFEFTLLAVWGDCAQRKHQIAQNINDSKPDSRFLRFARVLSCCCLVVIAFFSLRSLLRRFGIDSPDWFKLVETYMAFFVVPTILCANLAAPFLLMRNVYVHLKWWWDEINWW